MANQSTMRYLGFLFKQPGPAGNAMCSTLRNTKARPAVLPRRHQVLVLISTFNIEEKRRSKRLGSGHVSRQLSKGQILNSSSFCSPRNSQTKLLASTHQKLSWTL